MRHTKKQKTMSNTSTGKNQENNIRFWLRNHGGQKAVEWYIQSAIRKKKPVNQEFYT